MNSNATSELGAERLGDSNGWGCHVDDLAGPDSLNCAGEGLEKRAIGFDQVLRDVDDHDAEGQLLKIVLMLKALVDGDQNVARALSLSNQLGIRQRAPLTLRDGHDSVMGESLPNARIDALV